MLNADRYTHQSVGFNSRKASRPFRKAILFFKHAGDTLSRAFCQSGMDGKRRSADRSMESNFRSVQVHVSADSLTAIQCLDRGFSPDHLLCANCHDLKQFKLGELTETCQQCCTQGDNEEEPRVVSIDANDYRRYPGRF